MALLEYKCPSCNGGLEFDANAQQMKCPYCDSEFTIEAVKAYNEELKGDGNENLEWHSSKEHEWTEAETSGMRVYKCQSCNGEVVADSTTGATDCPYCGNPVVMQGQFKDDLKPDKVIPFKLDKQAAKDRFASYLQGKKLLPRIFRTDATIEEIKGVYVPYWLFDANADARIRYKATKTRCWSDSKYNYTETSHFSVVRNGSLTFEHVPVDGSSKMDDTLMESLEPFDYKDAMDFETAYLSGYLADRYDVTKEDSINRANERIKNATIDSFRSSVSGYSTVTAEDTSIQLKNGKCRYALYPVWVMNVYWKGDHYMFAMNGQTGKFVGDLPCDPALYNRYLFKTAGMTALITFAILAASYFL